MKEKTRKENIWQSQERSAGLPLTLTSLLAVLIGPPTGNPLAPETVVWGFLLLGLAVHLSAKFALRRSFGVVAANRGVKVSGPYRLVRHPMYTGSLITMGALLLDAFCLSRLALWLALLATLLVKSRFEERLLRERFPEYAEYMKRTKRLVPLLF
jgi:protein-S-isoprenylcysteine O-methyltransferase Ste14